MTLRKFRSKGSGVRLDSFLADLCGDLSRTRIKRLIVDGDVKRTLAELSRAANSKNDNVFSKVVEATAAGVTHGEVVGCLRQELGFGHPLIVD